ncbi:acyl-CoA dehydrogenase [Advenella mimigardefordensis]|uniref:Putative acyl-CoA dehydrogenase n=1 Tax=Advenella mimigardefordensis (strain DSM 17166 / LMG 22922 / DPN7) TaxID=1247726 RepID=W0PAJ5_ADVMD|nr:acyl-CoA dehydrogenase [Advenella mimigardefordensis]AHG62440.1 putative acyl-CoA dehydrogenase [Advenella mimigardefordensis DPN7]
MSLDKQQIDAFGDSARDLLSRMNHAGRMRERVSQPPALDRDFWQEMAEAGWLAVLVPEEQGGLGLGLGEINAIAREMGAALPAEPLVAVAVQTVTLLCSLPPGPLRDRLLAGIADGSLVVGTAWQQRPGQVQAGPGAILSASEGALSVSGYFIGVSPATGASGWLILAREQEEDVLLWQEAGAEGVHLTDARRVDTGSMGTLQLQSCPIDQTQVLARGAQVLSAVDKANDYARIALSAQLLGCAGRAFDITLEYMKVRVQFGKPIGAFQSLQHRMVDSYIQLQMLEFALWDITAAPGQTPAVLAMQASRLKARAEQAAGQVTRLAVQMHGGMGYSDESDVGLMLKKTIALSSELGNRRAHLTRYLQLLQTQPAASADTSAASSDASARADARDNTWTSFPTDRDWDAMPEAEFRQMLRAFYHAHYPEHLRHRNRRLHWHEIGDWYRTLARQKWIAPAWPKQYGGMALSAEKMIAYIEEQERYGVGRPPDQGLVMLGPILIRYGTPEQQQKYLPAILSGEHVWAQGYSEPNAGSDLASLRCEAVVDGDDFVVNGQKTWSTLAQDATHMFMLVRTDKEVKKQAGISFLMADLRTPGITVRPIRTIAGDEEYCEIFFDNVRVPKENLVGELNQGWTISKALLGFERLFSGNPKHAQNTLAMIDKVIAATGLHDEPAFMAQYAQLHMDIADLSCAYAAFSDMVRRNEPLPAKVSLLKIWATETHEKASLLLLDAAGEQAGTAGAADFIGNSQGQAGSEDHRAVVVEDLQMPLYNAAAAKIFSGTNEIQRNILAKVVLALPVA